MHRSIPLFAALAAISFPAVPVFAADYPDMSDCCSGPMRDAYSDDWGIEQNDDLDIEVSVRDWFAMGAHTMTAAGGTYSVNDTSHIIEGGLRIEDHGSDFYAKAILGYSAVINSSYTTPSGSGTSQSGTIGYVGGDIGYTPLGDPNDNFRFGGFAGYMYWDDSPDMGRENFLTAGGGGNSQPNAIRYQMIRLGLVAKAKLGDVADITAEAAVVPYANLSGTYGALTIPTLPGESMGSSGTVAGWLYGAGGEVVARYHPMEHWTIGLGARAWYLTGQADVTFDTRVTATPGTSTHWITKSSNYSTFRYGILGEITYDF